ncbi:MULTISPECIES: hypothetical protein [unclassified Rahnella]|uniref:hypothetical protein n=1 Tax=unclassified Rahnella TaxID=2635087 RepID=UPI001020E7AC|nr:hypothetical protein [Rahnella sp. CFA14(1/10)]
MSETSEQGSGCLWIIYEEAIFRSADPTNLTPVTVKPDSAADAADNPLRRSAQHREIYNDLFVKKVALTGNL